jgi:integrase
MGKRVDKMARHLNRLTALMVSRKKRPGLYADGGGLYLRVADGGSKQWIYRYVTNGRCRDMGIGPERVLTLAEARERARLQSKLRLDGIDPIAYKHEQRAAAIAAAAKAMSFRQCAELFIADHEKKWTNAKHRRDWKTTLVKYAYPALGDMPVASIDTPLVLKAIKPLWERAPETASRVRGRIENVLGWATVHHYRTGDNPARWRGHLEHALPARSEVAEIEHHAALPYKQAAAFVGKLRQDTSVMGRCLEFITLTASRLTQTTHATWSEIDLETRVWTVAGSRMKSGKEHRVPLSAVAVAILKEMAAIKHSDYVFPGYKQGRPLGHNGLWTLARRVADADITVHGLRSTFRDWAADCTSYPNHVVEMALAHPVGDKVEAAYRRGDLFEKRRRLMGEWARYCAQPQSKRDNVRPIRAG